jgi:hypothetical protein
MTQVLGIGSLGSGIGAMGKRKLSKAAVVLLVLTAGFRVQAQQVLVEANVADDTIKTTFGPNRRYFGHVYGSYGLLAGASGGSGARLRYGLGSVEAQLGGRLKRRLSQTLALNLDVRYAYQQFSLAQNAQKTVPTPMLHKSESLSLHHLQSELSLRLNAGRRGNVVGRYLDLLAYGGWVAGTSHTTEDEPSPGITSVETTESGLPYLRRWTGGVGARLGSDRYALVTRYRLSSVFRSAYPAFPELPRWVVGVELGWF